jgi:maltose phosphorylase
MKSPLNKDSKNSIWLITDASVTNEDANWDEKILEPLEVKHTGTEAFGTNF